MAVPGFQDWFKPLLRRIADGTLHSMDDLYEQLADELGLTEEDRQEVLPSGTQKTYRNRIGWARTYLKKAGLVSTPARAHCQITDRGVGP
jgi:restriction system protein